jgi:glycosyltransferase involved in cell wall biosynthesis
MHIPWSWIKQRPHFIAEELSNYFLIDLYYEISYKHFDAFKKFKTEHANLKINKLIKLPFNNNKIIRSINRQLISNAIQKILKYNNFDYLWITHPRTFSYFKDIRQVDKIKIIYDCMDDVLFFPHIRDNKTYRKEILALEEELCNRAHYIFFSSDNLHNSLSHRYNLTSKSYRIINNGIKLYKKTNRKINIENFSRKNINLFYAGTISEWFDFDLILKSLEHFQNLHYYLAGPTEVNIPRNNNIHYAGIIEHSQIYNFLSMADILIMPFKMNKLTLSVDPVKIYEYIYSCKPIIAPDYPETRKFNQFVYLYNNPDNYIKTIDHIVKSDFSPRQPRSNCHEFARQNTWQQRANSIKEILRAT